MVAVHSQYACHMQCVDAVTSAALEEDMQHLRGSRRRQRVSAVQVIDSIREFMNASCLHPFTMKVGLVHHAERNPDKSLSFKPSRNPHPPQRAPVSLFEKWHKEVVRTLPTVSLFWSRCCQIV
jgi:hypothetical protein